MKKFFTTAAMATSLVAIGAAHYAHSDIQKAPKEITIEEYADFECRFCAKGDAEMKQALQDYPGQIKVKFRNMPLPFHEHAMIAAKAFGAISIQSQLLANEFQRQVFENQKRLSTDGDAFIFEAATKLGVNIEKMKNDMDGEIVAHQIAEDQKLAQQHDFTGTPSFIIGRESVTGAIPYAQMKKIIDKQLAL